MNSKDSPSVISSTEFQDGRTLSISRDGLEQDLFGVHLSPANPFPAPGKAKAKRTIVTSGRNLAGLSASAVLSASLASRLRVRLAAYGSPEYKLTWKQWVLQSGLRICAVRALGRRTSDNAFTGWPSPQTHDRTEPGKGCKERGGAEETTTDRKPSGKPNLQGEARMAGWNSPRATDGSNGGPNQAGGALSNDASKAGYSTPCARDYRQSSRSKQGLVPEVTTAFGPPSSGIPAQTASKGGYRPTLNVFFSAWLMGFPPEWTFAGLKSVFRWLEKYRAGRRSLKAMATQSMRNSPPSS